MWRCALRLAWRDLKSARGRVLLITLSAAISMAGIAGVYSAASVAREALQGDSRAYLAGDIGVDLRDAVDQEQAAALTAMRTQGVEWTLVATALTMAASDQSPDAAFIGVKAVDPALYPFYGAVTLSSGKSLRETLTADSAAVSQEVLDRLSIHLGDVFTIAGQPFRAGALLTGEPDRFSGSVGLGMRCILSKEAYLRTRLEESGTSLSQRVLLRLSGTTLPEARRLLEKLFPGGAVREYRNAYGRQLDAALTFLSVTAFLALVLGAIGVWILIRHHAADCMAKLATVKVLGAGGIQTSAVLLVQVAILLLAATLLAAAMATGVELSVLSVARKYLALPRVLPWRASAIVQSTLASSAALAAALVEPLGMIWRLRPAVMFRHAEVAGAEPLRGERKFAWISATLALVALVFLADGVLKNWKSALLLTGGVTASMAISWILAGLSLRLLKLSHLRGAPPWLRIGLAGLYRPGNRSGLLVTALSVAFLTMIATFEARGEVIRAVFDVLPYQGDSLYITRFKNSQKESLNAFLSQQPGVRNVRLITQSRVRLRHVYPGYPPNSFYVNFIVTCEPKEFFQATPNRSLRKIVVAEEVAYPLSIRTGYRLELESRSETIQADVAAVRKLTPAERVWSTLHMDCSGLEESNLFHQAAVQIDPPLISPVRRALMAEFPTFAVITAADITDTIGAVGHDAILLVRLVAWLAGGAGLCVLLAIIAASRGPRLRETGILRTLGAHRSTLVKIFTVEFAAIGMLAGTFAALLSAGFATLVLSITLDEFHVAREWKPALAAIAISILLTIAGGWLPTWGLLKKRPMDILRSRSAA
jgi:putative ABC transport system permease protein